VGLNLFENRVSILPISSIIQIAAGFDNSSIANVSKVSTSTPYFPTEYMILSQHMLRDAEKGKERKGKERKGKEKNGRRKRQRRKVKQ
jgi:hypothetical protein